MRLAFVKGTGSGLANEHSLFSKHSEKISGRQAAPLGTPLWGADGVRRAAGGGAGAEGAEGREKET